MEQRFTNSAVSGSRFVKYWLPVIVWMTVIFSASTGAGSSQHTSRFIGPLLRWMFPGTTDETVQAIQFGIRKTAHVTEYAILAALLWRARRQPALNPNTPWNPAHAYFAVVVAGLYAVTDELHQAFVPSRQGNPWDVLIDTIGAALGIYLIWWIGRKRKRW